MTRAIKQFIALFLLVFVTGCTALPRQKPVSTVPVCEALIGPITYNSTNATSPRHAGKTLAKDLKARNNVGRNLGCKGYRS